MHLRSDVEAGFRDPRTRDDPYSLSLALGFTVESSFRRDRAALPEAVDLAVEALHSLSQACEIGFAVVEHY